MSIGAIVLTVFCFGGCVLLFAYFIWQSARARRIVPGLWIAIAYLTLFWLESPFSYITYATYNPELPRLGHHLGPLSMIYGRLPILAIPGYVAYFVIGGLVAKAVAERIIRLRGTNRVRTLVMTGILVGFLFDFIFEQGLTSLDAFHYTRIAPWTSFFPGSISNQFPIYISIGNASMHTLTTYLLGTVDRKGDFVIERWARRVTASGPARMVLTLVTAVVLVHVVYLGTMVPNMISKSQKWDTTSISGQLYHNYPNQPK